MSDREPSIRDLANACGEALDEEAYREIVRCADLEEALGLAFTALIESGIEDPETYLAEKGILARQGK